MDEEINKVKTAIRRIRPLLLHLQNPSPPRRNGDVDDAPLSSSSSSRLGRTAIVDKNDEKDARSSLASSDAIIANSSSKNDEMIEQGSFAKNSSGNDDDGNLLHAEEAVTELANGLSLLLREMDRSIYYNAAASYDDDDDDDDDDCYTDDEMITGRGHRKRKRDDGGSNGQSSKKSLHHHHATPTTPTTTTLRQQRDYENVKILLQEGYGLLFQTTTTELSTMKSRKIILSSLVKRLISVDTNYCRHLLLTDYIPHFIILPPLLPPNTADATTATSHMTTNNNNRNDVFGGLPDWLIDANEYDATTTNKDDNIRNHRMVGSTISTTTTMANDTSNNSNSSSSRSIHEEEEEEEIQQLLQAFATMIHNDITILPPFLSLLSTLFTTTTITNDDDNEQITSLMMLLADTKEEENYNAYDLGVVDNDKDDTDDDDDDDDVASNKFSSRKTYNASTAMITNTTASNSSITSSIKNVREYCFQSCLSVLSSYTLSPNTTTTRQQQQQQMQQNDLSCLLHSLFKLVDTKQEGRCVIIALRNVWKSVVVTTTLQQKKRQNNYGDENHDTTTSTAAADNYGHDLFSIGNMILQSILSFEYKVSKSRYLIYGYMFALGRELHCQKNGEGTEGGGDAKILNEQHQPSEKFSLLDTIVLIALYTNLEYSTLIESIIDSLSNEQTLSLLQLILSLIQSWIPPLSSDNNNNNSGRVCGQQKQQRKNSLLYEQLASPLMSILFYIMISCSSKVTTHDDDGTASSILGSSSSLLMGGGLLPFRSLHASSTTAATTDVINSYMIIIDTCCHVSSKLYAAMDTQRQQQLISSLLAMVSDSFVRSVPTDLSSVTYQQLRHRKKEMNKNTHGVSNNAKDTKLLLHVQKLILLESARTACCTILLIANGCASDLVQIRGTVINQILILASKLDNTDSAATNNEECNDDTYHHLFDMNCAIVISLLQDTTTITPTLRSDSGNSSELLIFCQKLLFTSNFASTTTNSTYQHRVICGIILAARLLRCKLIPIIERESIWTWVITVITPSVSLNRTPLDALDPKIAHWGLTFLQFTTTCISPPPPPPLSCESDIVPKTFHYIETQPISGDGEGFNQVNRMLATASIVQMEDSLRMPVANGTGDDDIPKAFLAFGKDHDQLRNKKTATGSNMVICAPYFLHGKIKQKGVLHVSDTASAAAFTGIKSLPSINVVANYVYALVDRYLELGTQKSGKWNPRGWLLAKVQLPSCLSMSAMEILGMNKEYGLELDSITYCGMTDSFDGTDDNFLKRWRLLFVDEVKPKVTIVENLVQFVNCVVISISVSCAVLKHAYHHLQQEETIDSNEASMLESTTMSDEAIVDAQLLQRRRRKQLEALRKLLYFQVSKIHTLQRICKNIYLALDGLHSEVCRLSSIERTMQRMPRNNLTSDSHTKEEGADCDARDATRRNEHKALYERKRIPLSEVKSITNAMKIFLASDVNAISSSILWSCLDDDVDDAVLLKHFNNSLDQNENSMEALSSFTLRASRIYWLRSNVIRSLQHNIILMNSSINSACYSLISLCGISRVFGMTVSLSNLMNVKNKGGQYQANSTSIRSFLSLHYKLLSTVFSFATKDAPLRSSLKHNVILREERKQSVEANGCSNDKDLFSDIIKSCAEVLLSAHSNDGTSIIVEQGVAMTSTVSALTENLILQLNQCLDASCACHILDLLSILLIYSECSRGTLAALASNTLHSVFTMSIGEVSVPYTFLMLQNILSNGRQDEDSRSSIVQESFALLGHTSKVLLRGKDSYTAAFNHFILAQWSAFVIEGASQNDCLNEMVNSLDDFLAASTSQRSKQNSNARSRIKTVLPGLNEKTYTSLFELVLHMISTSLSLAMPYRVKKMRSAKVYHVGEPYEEIFWPMKVFGKLLSIFQMYHIYFPRRFLLSVVKSSLLTIKRCDYQLQQCVLWRNSQSTRMGLGVDSAAAELLQPLVNGVASSCIENITSFCNTMKNQQNRNIKGLSDNYKHTKAIAGLLYRCERVKETLQSICQVHNLFYPKNSSTSLDRKGSSKRIRETNEENDETVRESHRSSKGIHTPRKIRSRGSPDKSLKSPSVLELLPDPKISKGVHFDSIDDIMTRSIEERFLQSDSEDTHMSYDTDFKKGYDESIKGSDDDDDSFGVIGHWGC